MVFLLKVGPMYRDFLWKSSPWERYTTVCSLYVSTLPPPPDAMDLVE